jgi:lipoprotein-anchoring transpeptidase ErfK/SrfK
MRANPMSRRTLRAARAAAAGVALVLLTSACEREPEEAILLEDAADTTAASVYWSEDDVALSAEDIEAGRLDESWRSAPSIDSMLVEFERSRDRLAPGGALPEPRVVPPDSLDVPVRLPVGRQADEQSVAAVQILLDRSPFSPGVIDGQWGKNTEKAVFWLQRSEGLDPTGQVDSLTFAALHAAAGSPAEVLVTHTLTADDVAGPFVDLPANVYARAELDCLCYETLAEKLGEVFHATPELLAELNPGVELNALAEGDTLVVPAIDDGPVPADLAIAAIVVSDQGHYLHVVDSTGAILSHYPTTLGSRYSPSPTGEFHVRSVTRDPWFHWQPALLEGVPDENPTTKLPPGPNSPVGQVWIALSIPHYGIHGTAEPAAIGYATSSGCVRLTNWDAVALAERVAAGTPVRFRDLTHEEGEIAARE